MNNIFSKFFNWFFGSFFRTMGRFTFYILVGLLMYFLFSNFGTKVKASEIIYSMETTPNNLYSAVNYDIIDKSTDIDGKYIYNYFNSGDGVQDYPFPRQNGGNSYLFESDYNKQVLRGISRRMYAENDAFTNIENTNGKYAIFNQITFGVANNPLTYQPLIFPKGFDYKFSFLVAVGEKNNIFSNDNFGWVSPSNENYYFRGDGYNNNWSWDPVGINKVNFTRQWNKGNLIWLSWTLDTYDTFNNTNFSNTLFIPNTRKIFSKDSTVPSQGIFNWLYIVDWKVERIIKGSNDTFDTLNFNYSNINDDGYWTNSDLGLVIDGVDGGGNTDNPNEPSTGDKIDDSINNMNDNIMDSSSPDISGLENAPGWLPPGPLDSVINLPINLLNNLNNQLNGTCQPINFTIPFINKNLTIPCISDLFKKINGLNEFLDFIGAIAGGIIMYNYLIYLYGWVDDITSLKHFKTRMFGAKSDIENWAGVE